MKKVTIILTGVILMSIAALNVNAQSTATESADATANILQHLTLVKNVDLAFGDIITDTDGGTVKIAATLAGGPTYDGLPTQLTTTTAAAKFTASGQDGATFAITLPGTVVITNLNTKTMEIADFISSKGTTAVSLTGGSTEFYVGATLTVGAAQEAGLYSGTFPVTVTYE